VRLGVSAVLAILLAAFAAHFLLADRGYVLINFRGYVVEMSVPGLIIVLVATYLLVRAIAMVLDAPRRWRAAREARRIERSGSQLAEGLRHLIEGNWARSERLLTQSGKRADAPSVNYLLAARAAHLQGATERRDEWLKLAHDVSAEDATSAWLTKAELELQSGDPAAALVTLTELEAHKGEQPAATALLARAQRARGDGAALLALLPRLPRAHLPAGERDELVAFALGQELASPTFTAERLDELWRGLATELKAVPAILALRAGALQRFGRGDEAERELKAALKRTWDPALVQAYGEVQSSDAGKQLKQVETWLKAYPDDATLLLAAARLCMAGELWGKACSYLESSLALRPAPDTYALYGRLLTSLGEGERAALAFRSGLGLVSRVAAEPLPPSRGLSPPAQEPTS
jgi:HemY protein